MNKDYVGAISILTDALLLDNFNYDAKFYRALAYLDSSSLKEAI
jgi:hypothetical protein